MPLHDGSDGGEESGENGSVRSEHAKSLPADVKTLQHELLSMRLKIDSMERLIKSLDLEPGTVPRSRSQSPSPISSPTSPSSLPMPKHYDGPKPHASIRRPPSPPPPSAPTPPPGAPLPLGENWGYGSRPLSKTPTRPYPTLPRPLSESAPRRIAPYTTRSHGAPYTTRSHGVTTNRYIVHDDTESTDYHLTIDHEEARTLLHSLIESRNRDKKIRRQQRELYLRELKDISAKARTANPREAQELRANVRAEAAEKRQVEIVGEERLKDVSREMHRAQLAEDFYAELLIAKEAATNGDASFSEDDALVQRVRPEQGPAMLLSEIFAVPRRAFNKSGTHHGIEPLAAITMLAAEIPVFADTTPQVFRPSATGKDADPGLADDMANSMSRLGFQPTGYSPQEPLPERIRVCEPIVRFLEQVCVWRPARDKREATVLLRPYRMLFYNEADIRGFYLYGADRLGVKSLRPPTARPVSHTWDGQDEDFYVSDLKYIECLLDFMDKYLVPKLEYIASPACERITFPDMWHLFKPGDFVMGDRGRQIYRILSIASSGHRAAVPYLDYFKASQTSPDTLDMPFRMLCVHIDFDGRQLGPVTTEFAFKHFDGAKAISTFEVQPARFDRDPARRSRFVRRGRQFFRAAAVQHLHYAGLTLDTKDEVDSQVVVDFGECLLTPADETKAWQPFVAAAIGDGALPPPFEPCDQVCCYYDYIYHDEGVEAKRDEDFMSSLLPPQWKHSKLPSMAVYPRTLGEANTEENKITDDEYLIMSYRVFGFVLKTRKWGEFERPRMTMVMLGLATPDTESSATRYRLPEASGRQTRRKRLARARRKRCPEQSERPRDGGNLVRPARAAPWPQGDGPVARCAALSEQRRGRLEQDTV